MTSHHVRVPPDSSGKRITQKAYLPVSYTNKTAPFEEGDDVTTASGVDGEIANIQPSSPTAGIFDIILHHDSAESVGAGENLIVEAGTVAQTAAATTAAFYTQQTVQVGFNNPKYGQNIDNKGAASTRFAEGSPLFDAFGGLKVNESNLIGVYEFSNDEMLDLFTTGTQNGGTVTFDPVISSIVLAVTTASGSKAIRATNKYHFYWPGAGNVILQTVACSDTGVVGNTRRWGYFDEDCGIFFELDGTTVKAALRSKVSGAVVDTYVAKADWSGDRVDGSGGVLNLSKFNLDVSKLQIYWFDFAWLGAGRVRMGVFGSDGTRITCHEFNNAGLNAYPYMQNGSLPIRFENFNTALIGATPSLRSTCTSVRTDGKVDYTFWRWAHTHPQKSLIALDENVPLLSMRCKDQINGKVNPVNIFPERYSCYVAGGVVRVDFAWPVTLTGATFAEDDGTTVEFDHAATAGTIDADYWQVHTVFLSAGGHEVNLEQFFDSNDEGVIRGSSIGAVAPPVPPPQVPFTITATHISGTPTIDGTLTYKELR